MTGDVGTTIAPSEARDDDAERCIVVHPHAKAGRKRDGRAPEGRLEEGIGLARAIGLAVVHGSVVNLTRRRPATLLGQGTVEELGRFVAGEHAGNRAADGQPAKVAVAVVDAALTPVQQRNLERAWNCKVIDRSGLILEIFGARARSREGRLQVELAALTYQRSRLVRSWTHLERQRGGFGFMGGPGETQIEADRRQIDRRITRLKRELGQVKRTRGLHREARRRVSHPVIALVGYTNAGKSTLFNRLTRATVAAENRLFATLDPTMRGLDLPSGRTAILSDTVGFVSDLPHELVAAFHATLEEVCEADVVVHVRDAAHPDTEAQRDEVHGVLAELGLEPAAGNGLIEVLNKIDLLTPDQRRVMSNRARRANRPTVPLSALRGEQCDRLLAVVDARLARDMEIVEVSLAPGDGATRAWLYDRGQVLERRDDDDGKVHVRVRLGTADAQRLARRRR